MPGRASSSEEICDPPSSAGGGGGGIEHAAPALKVAPSYIPPWGPSRIFAVTTAGTRGWGGDAGAAPRRDRRACGASWGEPSETRARPAPHGCADRAAVRG